MLPWPKVIHGQLDSCRSSKGAVENVIIVAISPSNHDGNVTHKFLTFLDLMKIPPNMARVIRNYRRKSSMGRQETQVVIFRIDSLIDAHGETKSM
jgi:hypothetical protein